MQSPGSGQSAHTVLLIGAPAANDVQTFTGRNIMTNSGNVFGGDGTYLGNVAILNIPNSAQTATGTPFINGGAILSVNVTFGGSGYALNSPVAAHAQDATRQSGSDAVISATVVNGMVTAFNVSNEGSGYDSNTVVMVDPPPVSDSQTFVSRNFMLNPSNSFAGTFTGAFVGDGGGLTNLTGNGGSLTNLNASQLTGGLVSTNVLPGFQGPNYSVNGGGYGNIITGSYATVAGGQFNHASALYATVGGGENNFASGTGSFVGGGGNDGSVLSPNVASGSASLVVGGVGNQATSSESVVVGGYGNFATAQGTFVGGGYDNTASAPGAFVGGGGSYANWTLQTTTNLSALPVVWTDVSRPYQTNGNVISWSSMAPGSLPMAFFRLRP